MKIFPGRFRKSSDSGECCAVNQMVRILEIRSQKTATIYSNTDEFQEDDGLSAERPLPLLMYIYT